MKKYCIQNQSPNLGDGPHVKGILMCTLKDGTLAYSRENYSKSLHTHYQWFLSDTQEGEYQPIPGMTSSTIILLTEYTGCYLKCRISNGTETAVWSEATVQPVQHTYGNPLTDWMLQAQFGVSHHMASDFLNNKEWVSKEKGELWIPWKMDWNQYWMQFDAISYAQQIHEIGAKFVILTLGQNSGYYCAPNLAYDYALQEAGLLSADTPNPMTTQLDNDIPMKIADALRVYDIKLLLYIPSNPPHSAHWAADGDYLVTTNVFDYTAGVDTAATQNGEKLLASMIEWWSLHYKDRVAGWWFDGCFTWNDIMAGQLDMSKEYNISSLANAAKAGNPYSIITFNPGLEYDSFLKTNPYQDYTAGETQTFDDFLTDSRWANGTNDCQNFLWGPIGSTKNPALNGWGCTGVSRTKELLVQTLQKGIQSGYVIAYDCRTTIFGKVDPVHYHLLKEVTEEVFNSPQ